MKKSLVIATNNSHKLEEFRKMLHNHFDVFSLQDIGCVADPEETGRTFQENALIKAELVAKSTNLPVLADDSGLCVDALMGEPGIRSARYAGSRVSDSENTNLLLKNMKNIKNRSAKFVACLCLVNYQPQPLYFIGECHGTIALNSSGVGGFGYDPVFIPDGYSMTFAELGDVVKNQISHRAVALNNLSHYFVEQQ